MRRTFSLSSFYWFLAMLGGLFSVVFCSSQERPMDQPLLSISPDRPRYERPKPEEPMPELDFKTAFFETDKASLKPDAIKALAPTAEWLKRHPDVKVQIEGFCDKRGSDAYNLKLGERRAEAAKAFLVARGVKASRITTISYGRVEGDSAFAMAQNRRAGVVVIFPRQPEADK